MFAEEEWTDSPLPDGSYHTIKMSPAPGKFVGKRSLLRTLQTLGSVPDWETGNVLEDSDEEKDASTTVKATKKKRSNKRKITSNAVNEGKQQDKVDSSEPPVKKKPAKKTVNETSENMYTNDKGVGHQLEKTEAENKLSRKQWRNKTKNKKRCKNKYLPETMGVDDANAMEEPLVQTQDVNESKKVKKHDRASKKTKKSHEKNGISSISDNAENGKDSKTDKTSSTGTRIVDDSLSNDKASHKVEDKGKPSKMMKNLQAEKVRRILKSQLPDDGNKASEEPEEPKGTTVSLKGDEEQGAPDPSTALRAKMKKRLEAARFRYINELLYTSTSGEAKCMFQQDPEAIAVYYKGYTAQAQHWPTNPVDSIISYICKK
ncbi:ribosomal RNA-processing protein 8-like [Sinocyclocheilus grahami]|uniref:ribosomal RNA-processing protein 8-like n=1 Tax=Sinocyclocheilus grahami TaxID=75366 RepID=UPI0007AD2122|nr:PREDICTED: ribosomal RNA-processing protein 8-like [Sinocyclocheilus grahami]